MMRTYAGANALRSRAPHTEKKVRRTINIPMWRVFAAFHAKAGFQLSTRLARVSSTHAELLLYSENRVLCHLGDSEFERDFGWNPDLLLRLGIKTHTRRPLLFHQLAEGGQNELTVLF